ncbi:hypothetical protein HNY73_008050 [Argiope bruennichi]|uniref:Uncharacterized protein n=1 Tax=Argiope bruennichi TaxID=94029 RepID=A0A8T0F5C9_ARGBR|nr:hypothetical protein HNY73_008050 [Argiope bruennichi]
MTDRHSYNIGKPISPPARQDFHPGPETPTTNAAHPQAPDNSIQSCIAMTSLLQPNLKPTIPALTQPSQLLTSLTEFSSPTPMQPTAA